MTYLKQVFATKKTLYVLFLALFMLTTHIQAEEPGEKQARTSKGEVLKTPKPSSQIKSNVNKVSDKDLTPLGSQSGNAPPPIVVQTIALALLALSPFLIMLLTSFTKTVVVLSLLRQAIGAQQTPPNQVINGMALILAIYVMFPVGYRMYENTKDLFANKPVTALFSPESADLLIDATNAAKEPLRDFLKRNTSPKHLALFQKLAYRTFPVEVRDSIDQSNFLVVIPAFMTSQLKEAFEIGALIYLPFFVIDIVVSNILLAMGMMMMSPLTIALPLKLLLLVVLDGWTLLAKGLVLTYK